MIGKFGFFFILLSGGLLWGESITVLGIGSPCMDNVLLVDEAFLNRIALEKGTYKKCDEQSFQTIRDLAVEQSEPLLCLGGSTCNTLKGLAALGIRTAIVGSVSNDVIGKALIDRLHHHGVTPFCTEVCSPSVQTACLVTSDGERSYYAFEPPQQRGEPADLNSMPFNGVRIVHIEDYRLINGYYVEKAMRLAKEAGALVSFRLCKPAYAEQYRERILGLLAAYVDILFAEEQDIAILTHLPQQKAASYLKNFCDISVIQVGIEGCLVSSQKEAFFSPLPPTQLVDATGTVDLLAAGFLYGWLQGCELPTCAKIGNLLSQSVMQHLGAEIPDPLWPQLRHRIKFLLHE